MEYITNVDILGPGVSLILSWDRLLSGSVILEGTAKELAGRQLDLPCDWGK